MAAGSGRRPRWWATATITTTTNICQTSPSSTRKPVDRFAGDEQRPRPRELLEAEHSQADRGERQSWARVNPPGGIAGERRDQGGRPHDQRVDALGHPEQVFAHGHGQSEHGREHDGQDQDAAPPDRTGARNPR